MAITISGTDGVGITGNVGALTAGTAVASTSGTAINFTDIPSWVKRITVMFSGVSTNGTSAVQVQLGTSSGVEITGYVSASVIIGPSTGYSSSTSGIIFTASGGATVVQSGAVAFTLVSANTWVASGGLARVDAAGYMSTISGSKTLTSTLDRVRITTVNGTDVFDAGSINILFE